MYFPKLVKLTYFVHTKIIPNNDVNVGVGTVQLRDNHLLQMCTTQGYMPV